MDPKELPYRVFIVRCWKEQTTQESQQEDKEVVRFVLEVPATGERHGFTDCEALLMALVAEMPGMHLNDVTKIGPTGSSVKTSPL